MSAANYVPHTMCAGTREVLAPPKGCVAYIMYTIQTSGIKTLCTRKTLIYF